MNYKVLYRKYRPMTFDDVVEQKYIVSTLKNAIINNKIAQAYIFYGPRGTGKTSIAKIFAKTINCINQTNGNSCNVCVNCSLNKNNPDIIEIDAASNNSVEDIKDLISNCKLVPTCSKYKVYIIDEVHMLSNNAFNALLLTIEEPPPHVIFIFATTNIESVPLTILSRCQRFDFKQITNDSIYNHLIKIAEKENINLEAQAAREIAMISEGGMRDALGILEQLNSGTTEITAKYVDDYFGIVSEDILTQIIKYIILDDVVEIIKIVDELKRNNTDYKTFSKKTIHYCRNYILDNIQNINQVEKLKKICLELTISLNKISVNLEPYDIIEMIIINNCCVKSEIIEKVEDIKEEFYEEKPINICFEKIEEEPILTSLIRINNCLARAKKEYLELTKKKYEDFIENLIIKDKYIYSILVDSAPVVASEELVIIKSNVKVNVNLINANLSKIEGLYWEICEKKYKFFALSEEDWQSKRKEYLNNLKNNVKYVYVNETESNNNSEIEEFAQKYFESEKVIIE